MALLFALLQQPDIEEKINTAPDKGYEIGIFIGSMLPFIDIIKTELIKNNMDIMSFLSGNGLFLLLALVLIIVYVVNRRKRK